LTPIVLGYQAFLRRIFSFSDARVAHLILAQTQALTEFVTTWIDGRHDWMPILWEHLFCEKDGMVQIILGVYHSIACLWSDFDSVQSAMDVSRTLTACTTLLAVLDGILGDAKYATKLVDALPSLAGVLALFSTVQLPLQHTLPESVEQASHAIHRGFRELGAFVSVGSLPLLDYLHSLVRHAAESSFAAAPSWCQRAAAISHMHWKDENAGAVWVACLLEHLTSHSTSTSTLNPVLQCLHESMLQQQCWGSAGSMSLAQILLESLTKQTRTAVERVLCMIPPPLMFASNTVNLESALKQVLDAFDGPSVAWLLMGIALRLDELSVDTNPKKANYEARRDGCLDIARNYLLDKVRRGRPVWLVPVRDQIEAELLNRQTTVGLEWWKDVCLDILDKQVSSSGQVPSTASMNFAIECTEVSSLAPSHKRASSTTQEVPSTKVARMVHDSRQPASAVGRSEVASRRLQQVLLRGTAVETTSLSTTKAAEISHTCIAEPSLQATSTNECDYAMGAKGEDIEPEVATEPPFSQNDDDYDDDDYDDDCILLLELQ
jgi:hypothetical protein